MRKIALGIAMATAVVASPAIARDDHWYGGVEAGKIWPKGDEYTLKASGAEVPVTFDDGWDGDLVLGYDFGNVRIEAEAGYKTFDHESVVAPAGIIPGATLATVAPGTYAADGDVSIISSMLNFLIDMGGNDGVGLSFGAGAGIAGVDSNLTVNSAGPGFVDNKDTSFAWQGLAGLRIPVGDSMDIGVKYRYFNVENLDFVSQNGRELGNDITSHSVLASLLFNFGGAAPPPPPPVAAPPPPPPPPPPPAPQMQTCPNGQRIPVTQACPAPPPPPVPRTGERG